MKNRGYLKNIRKEAMKRLSGVLLIVLAIALLAFWEAKGREIALMDEVLVAAEDIPASEIITASMLTTVAAPLNAKVSEVVYANQSSEAEGKRAAAFIPKGAQLSAKLLDEARSADEAETSYFVIRRDWIYMCSSALRQGDEAEIVSADGTTAFGIYKVAFVKDDENDEITRQAGEAGIFGGEGLNARPESGADVDHIEIITDLASYMRLKAYAEAAGEPSLVIVLRRN
ncbi:MAG: SAF domain-containing protein [Clostridiales Family XIII bacterium]|jgi:hypothetical protein|nr:SAF domain-containing protein [Clostridiales Family XIII bacterium]